MSTYHILVDYSLDSFRDCLGFKFFRLGSFWHSAVSRVASTRRVIRCHALHFSFTFLGLNRCCVERAPGGLSEWRHLRI